MQIMMKKKSKAVLMQLPKYLQAIMQNHVNIYKTGRFLNVCVCILCLYSPEADGKTGGQPRGAELVHFFNISDT